MVRRTHLVSAAAAADRDLGDTREYIHPMSRIAEFLELDPFPHAVVPDFFPAGVYESALRNWPEIPRCPSGRIFRYGGEDLMPGDPSYPNAIARPGMREVYDTLVGAEAFAHLVATFGEPARQHGVRIDPRHMRLIPGFVETREQMNNTVATEDPTPEVFFRFDFQSGGENYRNRAHVDKPRRFANAVVFFCDSDAQKIKGGEFAIHGQRAGQRVIHRTIAPRHNTAVFFLGCPSSFHEAMPIEGIGSGKRRWIYYSLSSQRYIW